MILAHLDWQTEVAPIARQLRIKERPLYPSEQAVYDSEPELDAATAIGLKAWEAGSSCRMNGFSLGQIPQTAIDAWCDRHGVDQEAADFLTDALRYTDSVVIQRANKGAK